MSKHANTDRKKADPQTSSLEKLGTMLVATWGAYAEQRPTYEAAWERNENLIFEEIRDRNATLDHWLAKSSRDF